MAEKKVTIDNFSLTSNWNCKVTYTYKLNGTFSSASNSQGIPITATVTKTFNTGLPTTAKILSATLYWNYVAGINGGTFRVNDVIQSSGDGSVSLDVSSFSNGSIDVSFSYKANTDSSSSHNSSYPAWEGSTTQTVTYTHSSSASISNVYLLVEYQNGSVIYHAENGVLVPYQLFHAENGELVPYQIQHGEGGELVPY